MSRRFIFLLAATVVMLYFTVILFMLHPLHTRGFDNFSLRLARFQVPTLNWCKQLRWRSPPTRDVVALVSYPGSGNTWLRYLLQQVTGILTGSVYMDYGLKLHGFPAENVTNGSVLVVKTHEPPPLERDKFKSAILLIRNPRDAILKKVHIVKTGLPPSSSFKFHKADFNRLHKGHIGTAPKSAFQTKAHENKKSDWPVYVSSQLSGWEVLHRVWLTQFPGPVLVVFYEVLVRDARRSLHTILDFLDYNVTEADMYCAMAYREGIYRRRKKHKDFDPYTPDMYKALNEAKNRVLGVVADYHRRHNDTRLRA